MRVQMTAVRLAHDRAKRAHVPTEVVLPYVQEEIEKNPIRLEYDVLQHQEMVEIWEFPTAEWVFLNIQHPFVVDVILNDRVTDRATRSALEVMIMIIHGVATDMTDEKRRAFYQRMSQDVSDRLGTATRVLMEYDPKSGENLLGMMREDEIVG